MRNIKLILLVFAVGISFFLVDHQCYAQNIYANGSIDRDSISVGQSFNYKLDIRIPSDYILEYTELKDTLSKNIDIVKIGDMSRTPINNSNDVIMSQLLTLTSFDTGYVEIPKIGVKYTKSKLDTTVFTCYTNYLDIYVNPVAIDTTATYKPIKMPIKQSITFVEVAPIVIIIIVAAALVLLIIYIIKRSKHKPEEIIEEKPQIPAIVIAREKLSQLKDTNVWQSGKQKEYYTKLTDIVREYLEGQFNIEAIEMTSDEILDEVKKLHLDNDVFVKLQNTLITSDLVKFAKANPDSKENESAFNDISTFVEESYEYYQRMEESK